MDEILTIEQVQVGGVPVVFAEGPGATRLGFVFGVGAADEPLPLRGVSHLCEHLVLAAHDRGRGGPMLDGYVTWGETAFACAGTDDEVVDFARYIATATSDPPLARLDKEIAILAAESVNRGTGPVDLLLRARYGARSFGRA